MLGLRNRNNRIQIGSGQFSFHCFFSSFGRKENIICETPRTLIFREISQKKLLIFLVYVNNFLENIFLEQKYSL